MAQHRDDGFKSCCANFLRSVRVARGLGTFGLRSGVECK
jgi:hypothetical protein